MDRDELILSHMGVAYKAANSVVRSFGVSGADADDVESEALASLVEAAGMWDASRGTFGAYAKARVGPLLRNWVRRNASVIYRPTLRGHCVPPPVCPLEFDPPCGGESECGPCWADVETYLDCIKPRTAKVIAMYAGLRGWRSHTTAEIGEAIGVTQNAVRSVLHEGAKMLRRVIHEGHVTAG